MLITIAVDIKWLGLRPSQVPVLELPRTAYKRLSNKDITISKSLLATQFIQVYLCHPDRRKKNCKQQKE
uniref:AlNc14C18G1850 protein n=1 Tax=Albugo laibachii Nc14 TaxID=890382 RepID=F0W4M9_9STRA|nr:AlNc14C18G1850 [Albugo laibachii Nc14]|eukprot:CCA16063.1 AlNc14C18G1850 [Albugo laibachii Nc14]